MDLRSSIDSDETIGSVGSAASRSDLLATARQRFPLSAPSPNDHFLTPTYTSAAAAGGAIYSSLLECESSPLHFTQSRMARFLFSSSSSSNESPDSNSPAAQAAAARRRLQQLLNLRSLSSSSQRGSTQSLKSSIESLQSLPVSARSSPIYSVYKSAVNVGVEEDVLVMDALGESVQMTCRARKPLELLSSSSSSSSINSSHFGPNFFKTEICRSWDECGYCRFGFRCQFAHGKEELRFITGSAKLKQESGKQSPALGSDGYYNKYSRCATMLHMNSPLSSSEPPSSFSSSSQMIQLKNGSESTKIGVHGTQRSESTFSWPPTEEEEAEIRRVLYEPSQRHRRLPVFQEIFSTPEGT